LSYSQLLCIITTCTFWAMQADYSGNGAWKMFKRRITAHDPRGST
jgi:hypothetical protein